MRLIDADALRAEWLWEIGEYTANEILDSIDDMPTVTPEMSAVEYLYQRERMKAAMGFPFCIPDKEKIRACVAVVEKWVQEHPEEVEE